MIGSRQAPSAAQVAVVHRGPYGPNRQRSALDAMMWVDAPPSSLGVPYAGSHAKGLSQGITGRLHTHEDVLLVTSSRGAWSAAALGVKIGTLSTGPKNATTDVKGAAVGHCTITNHSTPSIQSGLTVIPPHQANTFLPKVVASCHGINGYGKSTGLVQIQELGQLESSIAVTNTFSIPAVAAEPLS